VLSVQELNAPENFDRVFTLAQGPPPPVFPTVPQNGRFRLPDGTTFGIISSTTDPFCRNCDRSRLTADGMWYRCLYATAGTDLRTPLRAGLSRDDLLQLITKEWTARGDRGAEERLALRDRTPLVPASSLKKNPHLEMHTRGG